MSTAYRGLALSKFKILRSFFSNYQEEKKRAQRHDMNILGLRIKKVDYCNKPPQNDKAARSLAPGAIPRGRSSNYPNVGEWDQQSNAEGSAMYCNNESQMTTLHGGSRSELDLPRSQSKTECRRTSFISTKSKAKDEPSPKKNLRISSSGDHSNKIYDARIVKLQEFVFRMNFVHNVYVEQFDLNDPELFAGKCESKYRIWIGPGNNSMLIKSLIKRRFWWTVENDRNLSTVNFVWSQLKDNNLYLRQKSSVVQQLYKKLVS